MRADADLANWLVGGSASAAGGRVAVLEDSGALAQLRGSGWVDPSTRVFLQTRDGYPRPAALDTVPLLTTFRGTFTRPGRRIELDDGYVVQRIPYADAAFESVELPTELRVWGAEDFSAFLRDFDEAWATGDFAGYLTNPLTLLADEQELAGVRQQGPIDLQRIFVADGGQVTTSPTGPPLGAVEDAPADWARAYRRIEDAGAVPGSASLGAVLDDPDRRDALGERPGLARYLKVLRVHRQARRSGRMLSRISGFGGRLHEGLPPTDRPDPVDYPILARAGSQLWMIAGSAQAADLITAEQTAVLECEVGLDSSRERVAWAFRHLGITAERYQALRAALVQSVPTLAAEAN